MNDTGKIETYRGAVMSWECDSNGHMNVMFYINKYELAGRNFLNSIGVTKHLLRSKNYGVVVLEQNVKYLKEVFEDDLLFVQSELNGIGNKAVKVTHEMYSVETGEMVSIMKIALVLFEKRDRRAVYFPKEIKQRLGL